LKTFEELSEEMKSEPFWLPDYPGVSGLIYLDGEKSLLKLTSENRIDFDVGENGWFDLQLRGPKGRNIVAKNVVIFSSEQILGGPGREQYHCTAFPNILIFDASLNEIQSNLKSIRFTLNDWQNFFCYRYTEALKTHSLTDDVKLKLRSLRYVDAPEEEDFFDPEYIFVCSWPSAPVKFTLDGNKYSIDQIANIRFASYHNAGVDIENIGVIEFAEPCSFQDALDKVYVWRMFFRQVAMVPIEFKALDVSFLSEETNKFSPVFLTYQVNDKNPSFSKRDLHPAYIPLNGWSDRLKLSDVMMRWIASHSDKENFRVRVDRLILSLCDSIDHSDLIDLCASIDGLEMLNGVENLSKSEISAMAEAAFNALETPPPSIDVNRLKGLIGQAQRWSLHRKLCELSSRSLGREHKEDCQSVIDLAVAMRRDAAHRAALGAQTLPLLRPVTEALLAICVAFDLGEAGMPILASEQTSGRWLDRFWRSVGVLESS
jgi:hypothetical protein